MIRLDEPSDVWSPSTKFLAQARTNLQKAMTGVVCCNNCMVNV